MIRLIQEDEHGAMRLCGERKECESALLEAGLEPSRFDMHTIATGDNTENQFVLVGLNPIQAQLLNQVVAIRYERDAEAETAKIEILRKKHPE